MQAIAIAVAISAVIGGAVGAAATALTISHPAAAPPCSGAAAADATKHLSEFHPVPTTGSKGF